MERIFLAADLMLTIDGCTIGLHGELQRNNASALLHWLDTASKIVTLEMDELDIVDGTAAIQAVNAVRRILSGQESLCLSGAPQLLAHNLYRSGLLEDGRITLQGMREDEAYG